MRVVSSVAVMAAALDKKLAACKVALMADSKAGMKVCMLVVLSAGSAAV